MCIRDRLSAATNFNPAGTVVCVVNTVFINGVPKSIHNTNELLGNVDGVYGIKTGFTNGANRCV